MPHTPPFRTRPNLHLSLTPSFRSLAATAHSSPAATPFGTTTYSPYLSASLQPPSLQKELLDKPSSYSSISRIRSPLFRNRRVLLSKGLWFALVLCGLLWWWSTATPHELKARATEPQSLRKDTTGPGVDRDLHFFPASNPKIHYVGRWTAAPNRLRNDGTFPGENSRDIMNVDVPANAQGILGVYFDLTINGSSSLLLLLHNAAKGVQPNMKESISRTAANVPTARPGHLSFGAASQLRKYTDPISLLAQVDNEDFVLMPNASGIVTVRRRDMDPGVVHNVRVIAPMTEKYGGVVEFEGLWLDHGGRLLRVEGSQLEDEVEQEDAPYAENAIVGKQHGLELKRLLTGAGSSRGKVNNNPSDINEMTDEIPVNGERKKLLEILTDMPGSVAVSVNNTQKSGGSSLLGGVMGWEYLIGDMFGADHVSISVPGMCLMQDCIRATGTPIGLGDVFFRSGPTESPYFERPWTFQTYVPDVMVSYPTPQVLNMGGSDFDSFTQHQAEYNKTSWELLGRFEDTYVSLIKAIRDFGYPKHPDFVTATASSESSVAKFGPANIPIFIMRPFRGQFEHATQGVVNRLRAEGDKAVFWLDTSGWLDPEDISSNDRDFFLDDTVTPARWVLTERGNQRVAIFLHMHVCRYLASEAQRCAFLEPEVYQGKVFDPEATMLDRYIEREKGQKLREMFWENE